MARLHRRTVAGTAGTQDFSALSKKSLEFSSFETTKTVSVAAYRDEFNESVEFFSLSLFKNLSDTSATASAQAYITDSVDLIYQYVVSSDASSASSAAAEGGKITFTITRGGTGTASTVYFSTQAGTAGAADYTPADKQP